MHTCQPITPKVQGTLRNEHWGTSLVVQWLRIPLPVQGVQFWSPVWEDPKGRGATKPMCCNYWSLRVTCWESMQCNKRSYIDATKTLCAVTMTGCSQIKRYSKKEETNTRTPLLSEPETVRTLDFTQLSAAVFFLLQDLTQDITGLHWMWFFFFLIVVNFVIHWNETAMGLHVFPIPIPPPSPPDPSRSSQCTRSERLSHASNLGWWSVSP